MELLRVCDSCSIEDGSSSSADSYQSGGQGTHRQNDSSDTCSGSLCSGLTSLCSQSQRARASRNASRNSKSSGSGGSSSDSISKFSKLNCPSASGWKWIIWACGGAYRAKNLSEKITPVKIGFLAAGAIALSLTVASVLTPGESSMMCALDWNNSKS